MAKKKGLPPAFLANAAKKKAVAGGGGVGVGDKVVDPAGKKGKVVKVTGGKVHVKHSDGTLDKHPMMRVKKAAVPKKAKTK